MNSIFLHSLHMLPTITGHLFIHILTAISIHIFSLKLLFNSIITFCCSSDATHAR